MKLNLAELLGRKEILEQERENTKEAMGMNIEAEVQSIEELRKIHEEFTGESWDEEGFLYSDANEKGEIHVNERDVRETGFLKSERDFDEDGFITSIDEYEEENWATQNDPEKVQAMEDVVASDDETGRLDDWGLNEILGKEKYVKQEQEQRYPFPIGMDRFKRMRDAKKYVLLSSEFEKYKNLQPKRGSKVLSMDEIQKEISSFHEKRFKGEKMSQSEYYFAKQCEAFAWASEEMAKMNIESKKPLKYEKLGNVPGLPPHEGGNAEGKPLTDEQLAELSQEYDNFKNSNPDDFAKMRLELVGEDKVESGEWKKQVFTWQPEIHQERQQWSCKIGKTKYVTSINPESVVEDGKPASFYYTEGKAFPLQGGTLQFISIKTPEVNQEKPRTTKKVLQ